MLTKFLFFILISVQLHANITINSVYYVDSDEVMLSDIVKGSQKNVKLFTIQSNRHTKKVKSKELLKTLQQYGYKNYSTKHRYVTFVKKSPIETLKIRNSIESFYKEHYSSIDIRKIVVEPRGYIASLPSEYSVKIPSKSQLSNSNTISIRTLKNKKVFFDYTIDATIEVFVSRYKIKKGSELSMINTKKKSIILSKFRALPIQNLTKGTLEAKSNLKKDKILTIRDVTTLSVIKKNSMVVVSLDNSNIAITFSAKALQNGKIGDTITVVKSNGKRLKVRVIGRNRVEIR